MKTYQQPATAGSPGSISRATSLRTTKSRGLSLLEMIAVIAIMSILTLALVPSFVKRLDQAALNSENADLQGCMDALQRSIQRNRIIPGPASADPTTDWATVIATELGVDVSTVRTNIRNVPRTFLIDPNFQIGANGLNPPYKQSMAGSVVNTNGSVIPPISPRMIILSSIGPTNPPSLSTFPSATDFNAIWNATNYTIPAGPAWAGWKGSGNDLVIQRADLSGLFVHLLLFTYPTNASNAAYAIDRLGTNWVLNAGLGTNIYIIKNTLLGLLDTDGVTLGSEQIINQNSTFVFDNGVWRNGIFNVTGNAAQNAQSIADAFLASRWNINATGGTRQSNVIIQAMIYMNAYSNYAASGFSAPTKAVAKTAQVNMMSAVNALINNPQSGQCQ